MTWELYRDAVLEAWLEPTPLSDDLIDAIIAAFQKEPSLEQAFSEQTGRSEPAGELPEAEVSRLVGEACAAWTEQAQKDLYRQAKLLGLEDDEQERSEQAAALASRLVDALLDNEEIAARLGKKKAAKQEEPEYPSTTRLDKDALRQELAADEEPEPDAAPAARPAPVEATREAAKSDRQAVVEAVVGKSQGGSKLLYMVGGGVLVLGVLVLAIGGFVASVVFDVKGIRAHMPLPVQVALDRTPPVVEIVSPTEGTTRSQLVKIKLVVRDATLVRVTLNGKEISNLPTGEAIPKGPITQLTHEASLELVDLQPREIEVVAVDGAGLRTRVAQKIRLLNPGPPQLTLATPTGSGTIEETVQVTGQVRGLALDALSLRLNGGRPKRLELDGRGRFSASVALKKYRNTLELQAKDILGQTSKRSKQFDRHPPYSGATHTVGALHRRALGGEARAMASLAHALLHGRGVERSWSEARRWFILAAAAGDEYARGMTCRNGWGRARDSEQAAEHFRKAAAQDPLAMAELGVAHFEAEGVAFDTAQGEAWLNKSAAAGNHLAWTILGGFYQRGFGVKRDLAKAEALFKRAAAAGEPEAAISLARMVLGYIRVRYMRPEAGRKWGQAALTEGRAWYRKAAEAGRTRAMLRLAHTYGLNGWSWEPAQEVAWLRKAAEAGDSSAMIRLGASHLYGQRGLKEDAKRGLSLYEQAAGLGNPDAMRRLAMLYAKGYGELSPDPEKSKEWYRRERELYLWRATLDDPDAMRRLGDLYRLGTGVSHDPAKALSWYRKAGETGIGLIWWSLTQWLINPSTSRDELPRDAVEAVKWYRKAGAWGDPGAMSELATIYRAGEDGVPADPEQAKRWFARYVQVIAKRARRGHRLSMVKLAELHAEENPGQEADPIKAFEWRAKAAKAGHVESMRKLAELYLDGKGVAKDATQAVAWLEKAVAEDDAEACRRLAKLYESGAGVAKDAQQASAWYAKERALHEKLAAAGDTMHWHRLAEIYRDGIGVEKDLEQAEAWKVKAAETGDLYGVHQAVDFYRRHLKDPAKAAAWLKRAAEMGEASAMLELAAAYRDGKGVAKNLEQAVAWYEKAAARESTEAMRALGKLYGEGKLVAKDAAKSARWYRAEREHLRKSGYSGLTWNWSSLARIYLNGVGVAKNPELAIQWFRRADSEAEIARLYTWGGVVQKDLVKAAASHRRLAERGNTYAMRALARLLLQGKGGLGKDAKQAIAWYERAAKKNDIEAVHALARLFDRGLDVERDKARGLRWYRRELVLRERQAWRGRTWSMISLAKLYLDGPQELRSSAKGAAWYERAARKQDTSAIRALALLYEKGRHDLPKDPAKATYWYGQLMAYYRKRALKGDVWAMQSLAQMYMEGKGVQKDAKQAIAWYEKAAAAGRTWAKINLAQRYMSGRQGFPKDVKRALYWYEQAAAAKSTVAYGRIAAIYMRGYPGVPRDVTKGLRWYRKAAEHGDRYAMATLARIYELGQSGVRPDLREAIKWLEKSAEKGDLNAIRKLAGIFESGKHEKVLPKVPRSRAGYWYRKERAALKKRVAGRWSSSWDQWRYGQLLMQGKGGAKDFAEAAKWVRKAAERNLSAAMNALGELYEHGRGLQRSYAQAANWYRKATWRGNYRAYANLGYLHERGLGVRKNPYEAFRQYSRAAWRDGLAAYRLGSLYERGVGTRKDLNRAQRYYGMAARKGVVEATRALVRLKQAIERELARKKALELKRQRELELARKQAVARREANKQAALKWIKENAASSAARLEQELAASLQGKRNHAWLLGEGLTKSGKPVWLFWHDGGFYAVPVTAAQARARKVEPKGIASSRLGLERTQAMNTGLLTLAKPVVDAGAKVKSLGPLRGRVDYEQAGNAPLPERLELQGHAPLAGVRMTFTQPLRSRAKRGTIGFAFGTLNYPGQVHFKGPVVVLLQVWVPGGKTRAHPVSNTVPVLIEVE